MLVIVVKSLRSWLPHGYQTCSPHTSISLAAAILYHGQPHGTPGTNMSYTVTMSEQCETTT